MAYVNSGYLQDAYWRGGLIPAVRKGHACKRARIRASAQKTRSPVRRCWCFRWDDLFMGSTFPISSWPGGRAAGQQSGMALMEHGVPLGRWGRAPRIPPGRHVDPAATILQKHCSPSFPSRSSGQRERQQNNCLGACQLASFI